MRTVVTVSPTMRTKMSTERSATDMAAVGARDVSRARASAAGRAAVPAPVIGAIAIVAALWLPAAAPACAMTVREAYEAMDGHRHTDFDPNAPGFTPAEAAYLTKLFDLVDMAIVEKMQTFVWFQSEGKKGASFRASRARVDRVIGELGALEAPANLFQVQRLVVEAVREQRAFFEAWQDAFEASARGEDNREAHAERGRLLQSSSTKLRIAYNKLCALFPAAGQRNFDAFYDHLCVLDLQ